MLAKYNFIQRSAFCNKRKKFALAVLLEQISCVLGCSQQCFWPDAAVIRNSVEMERISVAIRVRPTKEDLIKGNHWVVEENTITLCNCYGAPVPSYSYAFDQIFGTKSKNCDVYNLHAKEVIMSAVQGFNCTVFAYGQTSSGKTYTMQGTETQPGIIRLAIRDVFNNIPKISGREFLIRVSYMEIYNEDINDLLAPENRKLQIHENLERGVFVAGLREEIVNSPDQVFEFLRFGEAHRHFGETNMNLYSSRSHTIFRMVIESRDKSRNTDAVRVSALNLVDLAGSERVAKTGAGGVRLKEGTHINKSLMTLGTVINKLSEGPGKGSHIPYRDSKLTRILQTALDGNAKTAIICTVTPDEIHIDETRGTLQFASRAKKVATCAHVNEILTDAALLKRQKREIEELRHKLQGLRSEDFEQQILKLRNDLLKYELEKEKLALELEEERKSQVERERRIKEQEQKIENLSTLVMSSAWDDRDHVKNAKRTSRRETWCPQQVKLDTLNESLIGSSKESDPVNSSMVSTRRNRDRSISPLPAFEALLDTDADALWSNSSKLDRFSELPELPVPLHLENVADEDTWMIMNRNHPNVADEATWMQLNKGRDGERMDLDEEPTTVASAQPYTPCVKSNKVDLLEFQLKELQLQFEELKICYKSKEEEAIEAKKQLDVLLARNAQTNKQLEELLTERALLQENNKQLDVLIKKTAIEEQEAMENRKQLDELVTKNALLQETNNQLELLTKNALLQEQEAIETKKQLDDLVNKSILLEKANKQHEREAMETKKQLDELKSKDALVRKASSEFDEWQEIYQQEKLFRSQPSLEEAVCTHYEGQNVRQDQASLIERLHMSEEHISVLQRQLAVMRIEKDRISKVLAAQVNRNEELLISMRLEKQHLAHELSRYLTTLSYQHDNLSTICSGIRDFVQA